MLKLLKRPVITEKTTRLLEEYGQYVFDVDVKLTKPKIRILVEKIFSVRVSSVNTHRRPMIRRSSGRRIGFQPKLKRAIVTLIKGEKIIFFPES
jgi:large subunit ribosomal protein L23